RIAMVTAVLLTLWFAVLFQYWHRDIGVDLDRRDRLVAFVQEQAAGDLPVAVAHPHDYLELAHDARGPIAARLVRLSDPERSLEYTGSRSTEDGLVVLAGFAPLRLVPYEEQLAQFLLLRTVRGEAEDWIEQALATDRARMRVVAMDEGDGFTLVRVEPARAR
ncbi:MAG: hypothetical protein ACRDPX_12450, partial [Gaiellaceae bacterium]